VHRDQIMRLATLLAIIGTLSVTTAQAQLRLPSLPLQTLTQTVNQTPAGTLEELSSLRKAAVNSLLRSNRRTLEADPHGQPMVRGEILAFSPGESVLASARTLGFIHLRTQSSTELDLQLVVLQAPAQWSTAKALKKLRAVNPSGVFDFNHIYMGSASVDVPDSGTPLVRNPNAGETRTDGSVSQRYRVGLLDSGVDLSHVAFHASEVRTWGCAGRSVPSEHGTAVASVLVGQAVNFHGVLPGATLYAANVYCDSPTGGAVDVLAAAFAWLAHEGVAVINVSLVGPDNAALGQIVRSLTSRGYLLIAAVGNDGPAAPPLYPASYPGVVGVTAVDAHRHVLIEAGRGKQVMFAAPGTDMAAATLANQYTDVRGTSFAAPIVAGILAKALSAPDLGMADGAVDALSKRAIDLGPPGRDLTYGYGLVGAEYAVNPAVLVHAP
jgi:subtilisin family serine protease